MTEQENPRRSPRALVRNELCHWLRRLAGWPWWVQVSLVYALARLFSLGVFLAVARQQGPSPWGSAQPDYLSFIGIWDSAWYEQIYRQGYPAEIPRGMDGRALENPWAFYALFPALIRGLNALTGLQWQVLAPLVATIAGFAAVLVIYRLFRLFAGPGTALWAIVFIAVFPVSPILQVPYAESLNLLLLGASLYLVATRRFLLAIPVVLLMCLSRPTGVPFAAALGLYLLWRLRHRAADPLAPAEFVRISLLGIASCAGALAWPVLAWTATGELRAYTDTETAWRGTDLVPFKPWYDMGTELFGPVGGILAPLLLLAAAVLVLTGGTARRIGIELRLWCAAYLGYLFMFLHPQTSTFRLMLPLFPLALVAAMASRSRAYRFCLAAAFLAGQIVWVTWLWSWAELPGGGDYPP
ncbi:integral membrane protein [Arthrobacter crystallopoietes BAB-32]|uniref:Integral membrane protein n=1 Tax=Arthrobacter crystallopoietes BAB-32 TaxID=1246476 RepID=N1V0B3_9MICC|nr:hypothetical protein [Arthrobacter crystallopoietes]EMY33474.1 integral membrane protein [Arthrobacter crystallopoietes BAB-32]